MHSGGALGEEKIMLKNIYVCISIHDNGPMDIHFYFLSLLLTAIILPNKYSHGVITKLSLHSSTLMDQSIA